MTLSCSVENYEMQHSYNFVIFPWDLHIDKLSLSLHRKIMSHHEDGLKVRLGSLRDLDRL